MGLNIRNKETEELRDTRSASEIVGYDEDGLVSATIPT
jgi:hypothetical protein